MEHGGYEVGSLDWLRYQATRITVLFDEVSADEAAAYLYLVIEAYKEKK